MEHITYDYIDQYINRTIAPNSPFFQELEQYAKANHIYIVPRDTARLLSLLTSLVKPARILEIGTAIGYSALLMYEAAGRHTHITTIERNAEVLQLAKKNICAYDEQLNKAEGTMPGLSAVGIQKSSDLAFADMASAGRAQADITCICGEAAEVLDCLSGPYDFVFLDAAKGQYQPLFAAARKLVAAGGLVVCDDVLYMGMTASEQLAIKKHRTIANRLRKFLSDICADPELDTALLPVGGGVALVRIRSAKQK